MTNDRSTFAPPKAGWWPLFGWASFLFFVFTQVYAVLTSPADRMMGHMQKMMYVHVPAAWVTFMAFGIVPLAGSPARVERTSNLRLEISKLALTSTAE